MTSSRVTNKRGRNVFHKSRALIAQTWESQANLSLFLGLLVVTAFLMPALGLDHPYKRFSHDLIYSLIVISGVAIGWGQRRLFILGACLGSLAIGLRWAAWGVKNEDFAMWRDLATLACLVLICWALLSQVFREGRVSSARVQGAVAAYLLLGLAWAHAYRVVTYLRPGSFHISFGRSSSLVEWYYFSFATLTTLGYGDIVPVSTSARSLAISESLCGQLYLTILIAHLVAMRVSTLQPDSNRKSDD